MMSAYYSDTHPKMKALQIDLIRQASPRPKIELLAGLNAAAHVLADLLPGEDLARTAYGGVQDAR